MAANESASQNPLLLATKEPERLVLITDGLVTVAGLASRLEMRGALWVLIFLL